MKDLVRIALKEDIGSGDITTNLLIPRSALATAHIIAKEEGVIAGLNTAKEVFRQVDPSVKFIAKTKDGSFVRQGDVVGIVKGSAGSILSAERVALNFLQRLSGIATLTNKFVSKIKGIKAGTHHDVSLLDTRKTAPGLREEEKKAVRAGGGRNHRSGLFDAILIKDNHLAVVKNISAAISTAKKSGPVEVEAKTLFQAGHAVKGGADSILLDNMSLSTMKKAVRMIRLSDKGSGRKTVIEASGGIDLKNVRDVAKTGVDYISVGALTHSAKALDISLEIVESKI